MYIKLLLFFLLNATNLLHPTKILSHHLAHKVKYICEKDYVTILYVYING